MVDAERLGEPARARMPTVRHTAATMKATSDQKNGEDTYAPVSLLGNKAFAVT